MAGLPSKAKNEHKSAVYIYLSTNRVRFLPYSETYSIPYSA